MSEQHDEEMHDENEHGPGCKCRRTDEHWHDDFAHYDDNRLPVPKDAPRLHTVSELINRMAEDVDNPPIYRFALVYVDAEDGSMQVMTNPGMSHPAAINLLSKAISQMSYQEAQTERQAMAIVNAGLGHALREAAHGNVGFLSVDPSIILGGRPEFEEHEPVQSRAANPDGYL